MTLHLLSSGARLSPAERRTALARMEEQLLEIFAALSLDERVLAVEGLSVRPAPSHSRRTAKSRRPPPRAS